jgi:nitroimidazol reductase NimA-like FMN-containing flavoprotein (pyridoxamine 5'-phosphate oxidase superfamily)
MENRVEDVSGAPVFPKLVELNVDECMRLLQTHNFGRLAFASEGWPLVLPVNYVFDGRSVVIRTEPGAKLDDAPKARVAFEIDEAAPDGKWGWSVVVRGLAFNISEAIDPYSESNREQPVDAWAPGPKPNWLRVSATRVTGRRFGNPPLW